MRVLTERTSIRIHNTNENFNYLTEAEDMQKKPAASATAVSETDNDLNIHETFG